MSFVRAFLIMDTETITDLDVLNELGSEDDWQKYNEGEFMPKGYHRIVAISFIAYLQKETGEERIAYESIASEDPSKVIDRFLRIIYAFVERTGIYPVIVTFNGSRFDLPILRINTLEHYENLSDEAKAGARYFMDMRDKWEKERANYQRKYSDYHIDLFEVFPSRLEILCRRCGIKVKSVMKGKDVERFYREGRLEKIALYCAEDTLAQAELLNRLLLIQGEEPIKIPKSVNECKVKIL